MARNFVGKILKFANHLAADYYTRNHSGNSSPSKGEKKKVKGARLHDEAPESFKEEANKPA